MPIRKACYALSRLFGFSLVLPEACKYFLLISKENRCFLGRKPVRFASVRHRKKGEDLIWSEDYRPSGMGRVVGLNLDLYAG